jgi:hypothetical protein
MTLRNIDGSVYKLAGPNPAMKSQNLWDGYTIHNMVWDGEKAKDESQIVPISSPLDGKESFFDALDRAKQEMLNTPKAEIKIVETDSKIVDKKPEIKIVETNPEPKIVEDSTNEIEKTFIHVLPARIREKKDSLYGDVYKTIQYDKPTSFEGVIISYEDITFQVWTNTIKLGIGSILYPKFGTKRWWRVQDVQDKANGWIMTCVPSDEQPSFDV